MFVQSQVEQAKSIQLQVKKGNTVSLTRFPGADTPNKPVNITRFDTIYKKSITEVDFEVPCILFDNENGRIIWRYYPTKEGEAMRDADYAFIMDNYSDKCPNDVGPDALR